MAYSPEKRREYNRAYYAKWNKENLLNAVAYLEKYE